MPTESPPTQIWRTAGGDNTRRACFPRQASPAAAPAQRLAAPAALQAAVVFDAAGTAFVAGMSGTVQAFNHEGKALWRAALGGGISATPAVHPNQPRLFVGTHVGFAYALDTHTGAVIWKTALPTQTDPRILSDLLFWPGPQAVVLSSWGERFCALAAETGTERFAWNAGISPSSAACGDPEGNLFCLRAVEGAGAEFVRVTTTGETAVLHAVSAGKQGPRRVLVAAGPVIDPPRATVYFLANQDQGALLHAWSLKSNSLQWTHPLSASVNAPPAVLPNGTILLTDLAGFAQAISPDGSLLSRYASGCEYLLAGGVGEAGGNFYFGDPLGLLHWVDAQGKGRVLFETSRALQARPSFDPNGRLYVPSTDRTVYVFPTV
jgi:outer membrane protein assembly factor BamB